MTHLARYAHLKELPAWKVGDQIKPGDQIGTMGNTGYSTGPHLHFDLTQWKDGEKLPTRCYRMSDVTMHILHILKLMRNYKYFLDDDLFGGAFRITTYFADPFYCEPWLLHPGYDIIPWDKKKMCRDDSRLSIKLNRTFSVIVHMVGTDKGYGNYLVVKYDA